MAKVARDDIEACLSEALEYLDLLVPDDDGEPKPLPSETVIRETAENVYSRRWA